MTGGWDDDRYDCAGCQGRNEYIIRNCQLTFPNKQELVPLQHLNEYAWKPVFHYKALGPDGKTEIDQTFELLQYASWECPKSRLRDGQAYELVRKYTQAKQSKTTLAKLMRDFSPFIEDVENTLRLCEITESNARIEAQQRRF